MNAQILDGKTVSQKIRDELKLKVTQMETKPGLAVVLIGEDPASQVYVNNKEKACQEIGFYSEKIVLPETTTREELLAVVDRLNNEPKIHGILVQFPLPKALRAIEPEVIARIDPKKDVDGFHPQNIGALATAQGKIKDSLLLPCTPKGIIRLLKEYQIPLEGKHVVVIGRSNLVGKPVSLLALAENATVSIAHSKTPNLATITGTADILIAAVGRPKLVTGEMVNSGAVVVDVGINRVEGKLVGDVDFEACRETASYITPVPGGVGPMTIAMLMENVLIASRQ